MSDQLKVASFFAGIGGFDLGMERAGLEVVFQCEINPFCQQVLKKHWPDCRLATDINKVQPNSIPQSDVWCGGFPCQDLSLANQGKRKGLGGSRSGLFYKFADLVSKRQPRWLVIENVPGLLNSNQGADFQSLLQILEKLGYGLSWRVLDAKYFGTPQRRRRVYVVGSYQSLLSAKVLFDQERAIFVDKQGLGQRKITAEGSILPHKETNLYSIQHASIGRKHSAGPQAKGYRNDGETYTLDSRGNSDAICSTNGAFRMRAASGIPSRLDGNRYRAIGNAVAVPVIEWIGRRIIDVDVKSSSKSLSKVYEFA